ncbi:MAG TPA: glutathione S-transferase family protein [Rhizobium sp.]|nr:glutathione S-transferase family protein [Rhizobium sp.]
MILIGQYDSSFVRRVGVALTLYGLPFEHRPWSVFGDGEKIQALNPLMRVPTMVLDDGTVLVDSVTILDHVDSLVPEAERLWPAPDERRHALKVMALSTGFADKGVSLFYELVLHEQPAQVWMDRCRSQMRATLAALEVDRSTRSTPFWFGDRITHADIAVTCALRHIGDSHPGFISAADVPALAAHCERLEALPVFKAISQPFVPPA